MGGRVSPKATSSAPFYSVMADECTDITTVVELSIYCRWVEDGLPVEHFLDIIPLTKADAKTIYTILVDVLRAKDIPLSKLVGMGSMVPQHSLERRMEFKAY